MKQHAATWAPDDWKPRKGPHRLAGSRRTHTSVTLEISAGTLSVRNLRSDVPIMVTTSTHVGIQRVRWVKANGWVDISLPVRAVVKITGPRGLQWAYVHHVAPDGSVRHRLNAACPASLHRRARGASPPNPLLAAAGFREARRSLATLERAEQAIRP